MAKKKLFGNHKEPSCGTCEHGKLSANGETVLCIRGGALPLTHHCRHYVYDPLRRIPKRRPAPETFDASDFALDDLPTETIVEEIPEIIDVPETETPVATTDAPESPLPDRSTFDHLFEYLNSHETPDADTILAILAKTASPEDTAVDEPDDEEEPETPDIEEDTALSPDDSADIDGDLEQLDLTAVPSFATLPLDNTEIEELLLPTESPAQDVAFLPEDIIEADDAPLSADDFIFLPKNTPSDHDTAEPVDDGFTPLTGNE